MAIYERPANVFVAGFIGSPAMNILPATVEAGALRFDGGRLPVGDPLPAPGTAVLAGLRPEHLARARQDDPEALALEVHAIETLGADAYAHCRFPGGTEDVLVVRVPGNSPLASGQPLHVTAAPGMLHLFDPRTGKRIATS